MGPVVLVAVLDGVDVVLDHGVAVVVVVLHRVHALVLEAAVGSEGSIRVRLRAMHNVGPRLPLGRLVSAKEVKHIGK